MNSLWLKQRTHVPLLRLQRHQHAFADMLCPAAFGWMHRQHGFDFFRREPNPAGNAERHENRAGGVGRIVNEDRRVTLPRKILQRLALVAAEALVGFYRHTGDAGVALLLKTGARQRRKIRARRAQPDQH